MPKIRHADTPLARFISNELGMNQTQFARAVGRHVTTVNRWLSGAIEGMDVTVAALILVSRRLPQEGRAAVWAELPNVPAESLALFRLLVAIDLLPRAERAEFRASIASPDIGVTLKNTLEMQGSR